MKKKKKVDASFGVVSFSLWNPHCHIILILNLLELVVHYIKSIIMTSRTLQNELLGPYD